MANPLVDWFNKRIDCLSKLTLKPWSLFVLQQFVFCLASLVIGLTIVGMTQLSEWAALMYRHLGRHDPRLYFVLSPLGLGLTAWLTVRFFPGSERSGIPQIKKTLLDSNETHVRGRFISLRILLGKLLLSIAGLLSGASVGFGGPAVHVGACVMHSLNDRFPDSKHFSKKHLIIAGSAAGLTALFNAPLAGIVFAIEELGRSFEVKVSYLILSASIIAAVTADFFLNKPIYFIEESIVLPLGESWLAILLCGLIVGFMGGLFSKLMILCNRGLARLHMPIIVGLLCGLILAIVNYLSFGATAGTGYQQTRMVLENSIIEADTFPFHKMVATILTFLSGIPSGIFVPSLATGAWFGVDLAHLCPIAPKIAMVLLSMAAYFSGVLQTPLTAVVIVMEMTDSHEILIPMMATSLLATWISKQIQPVPLYEALSSSMKNSKIGLTESSNGI